MKINLAPFLVTSVLYMKKGKNGKADDDYLSLLDLRGTP